MAARKTTVTHADGTVSTRKSQTRTYSHAIEVGPATAEAAAAGKIREAQRYEDLADALNVAANRGRVVIRDRRLGGNTRETITHQATLGTTNVYTWCSADGRTDSHQGDAQEIVPVAAYLIESARDQAASYERTAAKQRAEAADILAAGKPCGTYGIVRWSSRADLAEKALSEFAYLTERGYPVRVVEVDA